MTAENNIRGIKLLEMQLNNALVVHKTMNIWTQGYRLLVPLVFCMREFCRNIYFCYRCSDQPSEGCLPCLWSTCRAEVNFFASCCDLIRNRPNVICLHVLISLKNQHCYWRPDTLGSTWKPDFLCSQSWWISASSGRKLWLARHKHWPSWLIADMESTWWGEERATCIATNAPSSILSNSYFIICNYLGTITRVLTVNYLWSFFLIHFQCRRIRCPYEKQYINILVSESLVYPSTQSPHE